ncbi:MAG: 3'(2'),5'-bisphosphate nucleotidase CysQ [Rhodospirillaceae bacterium]|nr:3'(2'),5'-bisphosphate nucleotidase CysQ [Rhodospirillaceae bacterium]
MTTAAVDFATLNAWADRLIDTARAAGAAIMAVHRTDFEVFKKADASPVTAADQAAEAIVLADLEQLLPKFPIVAEERVAAHGPPTFDGESFWLVDALDGTKEFVKKGDEFTVNIAFVQDGLPVLGIVFAPARDALYVGVVNALTEKSGGASRAEVWRGGVKAPIRCRARPRVPTVAGSKSHEISDNMKKFLAERGIEARIKISSSLKFGLVAEGMVDLYPRFGPTSEWDTAAGHALVRAAGGRVHDQTGVELRYKKPDFRNGRFLVEGLP